MGMHDITMDSLAGEAVELRQFAGQYNLIVNVASF
jgi:glutathione peroxidase-family protein